MSFGSSPSLPPPQEPVKPKIDAAKAEADKEQKRIDDAKLQSARGRRSLFGTAGGESGSLLGKKTLLGG